MTFSQQNFAQKESLPVHETDSGQGRHVDTTTKQHGLLPPSTRLLVNTEVLLQDDVDLLVLTPVEQQGLPHQAMLVHLSLLQQPRSLRLELSTEAGVGEVDHGLDGLPGSPADSPGQGLTPRLVDVLIKLLAGDVVRAGLLTVKAGLQVRIEDISLTSVRYFLTFYILLSQLVLIYSFLVNRHLKQVREII